MKPKVDVVDWKLIGMCNLRCFHCYGPPKTERALPPEHLHNLIAKFCQLGVKWVVLTGGEPLLVPNIDDLMNHLRRVGLRIALSTNTSFFAKHRQAIEECVSSLNIPIDGSTPEIHAKSRADEKSFHTFFDVLNHYQAYPEAKPAMVRVGTVFSEASRGDFLNIARKLEPFGGVIDTWKIYELIDYEFQPDLRKSILHSHADYEREMKTLLGNTSLVPKIMLAPADSRNRAFFMVNPRGQLVVPTNKGGITVEEVVGDLFQVPLATVMERWSRYINAGNYHTNHGHYYRWRADSCENIR